MKTKRWMPIVAILLVLILSTIILVQGKRSLRPPFKETYSEYLSLTFDATSESSTYTPSGPVVVTVWVFPDVNYDGAEIFQIKILYNGLWVIQGIETNDYQMYNHYPVLVLDRIAVDYPITIEIIRVGNDGDDTETIEVQWIVEH